MLPLQSDSLVGDDVIEQLREVLGGEQQGRYKVGTRYKLVVGPHKIRLEPLEPKGTIRTSHALPTYATFARLLVNARKGATREQRQLLKKALAELKRV